MEKLKNADPLHRSSSCGAGRGGQLLPEQIGRSHNERNVFLFNDSQNNRMDNRNSFGIPSIDGASRVNRTQYRSFR